MIQKSLDEFKQVELLHWGHFAAISLAELIIFLTKEISFVSILFLISFFCFYRFFFYTFKKLYYTFWTFSFVNLIYILVQLLFSDLGGVIYLYLFGLLFLCVEMFILYSPIYYPIVNWWEYDFRYRYDLKIQCFLKDKIYEGRITDLRKLAGCVVLFEKIFIGESFKIKLVDFETEMEFYIEIINYRKRSPGRGYIYGVKFIFDSEYKKEMLINLSKMWREKQKTMKKLKFSDEHNP